MTQPIWYDSTEAGAPILNNAAGSLLDVLRACLVSGFNLKSVTNILVTSGVATVTCDAHGFSDVYGKLVQISGATEPLLNGNKQIGGVQLNSFTFPAPGVANGTYTGTISAKRAPLGWTEPHTGTNVAMFARSAPEATAMLLRVNDSAASGATATDARVVMVESATNVDAWVNESPRNVDQAGGVFWYKGANSTTEKKWAVVGNSRFLWLISPSTSASNYTQLLHYFGDLLPYQSPDPFACILCGALTGAGGSFLRGAFIASDYSTASVAFSEVVARGTDGVSVGARIAKFGAGAAQIGSSATMQVATSPVVISRPIHAAENNLTTTGFIRGEVPGLAAPLARVPFLSLGQFAVVSPSVGPFRRYLSVLFTNSSSSNGNALIDLTGPWHV